MSDGDDPRAKKPEAAGDTPMSVEGLRAFLALPATRARAIRIMRRRLPPDDAEDVAYDAVAKALAAKRMPREASAQAWFDALCRHTAVDFLRKRRLEKEHTGTLPVARKRKDEAGYDIEDDDDPLEDVDPSNDPERDRSFKADAFLLAGYVAKHVTDPEKRQTWAIMCAWAEGDKTYADLAREHGIPLAQLNKRVERLKLEIAPGFNRYRNGMFLLFFFGFVAFVVALWLLLEHRRPPDVILPDPGYVPPLPVSVAPVAPDPRLVAAPTQPDASAPDAETFVPGPPGPKPGEKPRR